jgi:hypothetical protein
MPPSHHHRISPGRALNGRRWLKIVGTLLRRLAAVAVASAGWFLGLGGVGAAEPQTPRPADAALVPTVGLAAKYPGDEGIEKDPRVLFVEDFESGDVKEIGERWGEISKAENMDLSADGHPGTSGRRSLHIANNGHLFTHTKGTDRLYARLYVKFHPKTGYLHHGVMQLIAYRVPTPWPMGGAGIQPAGDLAFWTELGPVGMSGKIPPPGIFHYYSYWHEMKPDAHGDYWGTSFDVKEQAPIQAGRWYCLEAMLKANSTPETADGEQTFWVDGRKIGEFKGLRWRATENLKINSFWLLYFLTDFAAASQHDTAKDRVNEVWFDDIVLATEYIGPMQGRPANGRKIATPARSALLTGELTVAPTKTVFSESFENGAGKFQGEAQAGSLAFGPKGTEARGAWSTKVGATTTIRFRVKPLGDVKQVTVLIGSEQLKDSVRYLVTGLKAGAWKDVEFRAIEARVGLSLGAKRYGPSLDGLPMDNIQLIFDGTEGARVLLDDFVIRE